MFLHVEHMVYQTSRVQDAALLGQLSTNIARGVQHLCCSLPALQQNAPAVTGAVWVKPEIQVDGADHI